MRSPPEKLDTFALALSGVNIKQLNSYGVVDIRQLPVKISNTHLQTTKDQSLIYIDAPTGGAVNNLLTLNGVTLTNMYLHKTNLLEIAQTSRDKFTQRNALAKIGALTIAHNQGNFL